MPLNLSVNEPRRSFCPTCKFQIPWYQNLPLFSWLALRGKCANCGAKISFRYFGVELLTGLLFLAIWARVMIWPRPEWPDAPWILLLPLWILVSLLVVATFIDFEHFIIPDEITWGGVGAGVVLSLAIPLLMDTSSNLMGGFWSLVGAAVGYLTLWAVVELGKRAFGKKRIAYEKAEPLTWTRHDDDADLVVGEETQKWSDLFARESDRLLVHCDEVEIEGARFEKVLLDFHYDRVEIGEKKWELIKLDAITGRVTEITIPREAMGFGDVKFIAAIGAFLGWQAVFFTVVSASTLGAVVGLLTIAVGRREWSAKIPFGPYLALGALIWIFIGPELVRWYLAYATVPAA